MCSSDLTVALGTSGTGTISYRDTNGFTVGQVAAQTVGSASFGLTTGVVTKGGSGLAGDDILLQGGAMKNPALPDVPFVMDLARNEEERQALNFLYAGLAIGRPVAAPPATPADRVKALRDAFDATMKDPEFIADAQKSRVRLDPTGGAALAALVEGLASTPQAVRDKVANILQ